MIKVVREDLNGVTERIGTLRVESQSADSVPTVEQKPRRVFTRVAKRAGDDDTHLGACGFSPLPCAEKMNAKMIAAIGVTNIDAHPALFGPFARNQPLRQPASRVDAPM